MSFVAALFDEKRCDLGKPNVRHTWRLQYHTPDQLWFFLSLIVAKVPTWATSCHEECADSSFGDGRTR